MDKRKLGNLEVSSIGLGCMGFSHAYGEPMEESEAVKAIRSAYDLGYTFFDTAEVYVGEFKDGRKSVNECLVGKALKDVRHSVQIATKCGIRIAQDKSLIPDSRPQSIIKAVDNSLRNLGTDYIDLYYQHRPDPNTEPEEVALTMEHLIDEGKILHWGISECSEEYLRRADAVCHVTAVQMRYSMMARNVERMFPTLEELGVGLVAFSPLANGFLTSGIHHFENSDEKDYRTSMPQYTAEGYEKGKALLSLLSRMAEEKNSTIAAISLGWMMSKKPYIVPIPGSRKIERIEENATAADIHLTDDEILSIDNALSSMDFLVFGGHGTQKR